MLLDHVRLALLLDRLRELEGRQAPENEQSILDVGRASLREAISDLSHRMHDADYCQHADAAGLRDELLRAARAVVARSGSEDEEA